MTGPALRARYLTDAITTASPARLLVMVYDRLLLDLTHGEQALRAGDRTGGSAHVLHAQDILFELQGTLDVTVWDGAIGLAQLYGFLLTELIRANLAGDADRVAGCRALVEPLCDAWRAAATVVAHPAPSATRVG